MKIDNISVQASMNRFLDFVNFWAVSFIYIVSFFYECVNILSTDLPLFHLYMCSLYSSLGMVGIRFVHDACVVFTTTRRHSGQSQLFSRTTGRSARKEQAPSRGLYDITFFSEGSGDYNREPTYRTTVLARPQTILPFLPRFLSLLHH